MKEFKEIKKLNKLVLNDFESKITVIEYLKDYGICVEDMNTFALVHVSKNELRALAEIINEVLKLTPTKERKEG